MRLWVVLFEVPEFEDGGGTSAFDELLGGVETAVVLFPHFFLFLLEEVVVKVDHFVDVGLKLGLVASVFNVHLLNLSQFVPLHLRVFHLVLSCHPSQRRVRLVQHRVVLHVQLVDESRRTDRLLLHRLLVTL